MSAVVGVSTDGVRLPIKRDRVVSIARAVLRSERVPDALLSVTFVSNAAIRSLNRKHLKRTGLTDVISTWKVATLTMKATGRGSYCRTRVDKYGFPRGYLMRSKSAFGFATGDLVIADVRPAPPLGASWALSGEIHTVTRARHAAS